MRLFIAVPLPDEAQAHTRRVLDRLRSREWPVRWVHDQGLHLTLKFFGEVTPDRLDAISEMLEFATARMARMPLTLGAGGVFPTWERPRVLHLSADAGPDLELLQDRIEHGGEGLGFPPEGRPFRPHLTLGRVREGHRLPDGWKSELEHIPASPSFLVDRVVLFESKPSSGAPMYVPRHEVWFA